MLWWSACIISARVKHVFDSVFKQTPKSAETPLCLLLLHHRGAFLQHKESLQCLTPRIGCEKRVSNFILKAAYSWSERVH